MHDSHDSHDPSEDDVIERIARELRRPESVSRMLDARVMAEVRSGEEWGRSALGRVPAEGGRVHSAVGRAFEWLTRPRTIRLSPLAGLAMAAGVALVVAVGARVRQATTSAPAVAATPGRTPVVPVSRMPGARPVQFMLVAPSASSVSVVGDFNNWDARATPLVRVGADGVWTVDVPLPPGRYQYTFIVNGTTWVPDPRAPRALEDDFGAPNSVVTVAESAT